MVSGGDAARTLDITLTVMFDPQLDKIEVRHKSNDVYVSAEDALKMEVMLVYGARVHAEHVMKRIAEMTGESLAKIRAECEREVARLMARGHRFDAPEPRNERVATEDISNLIGPMFDQRPGPAMYVFANEPNVRERCEGGKGRTPSGDGAIPDPA